MTMFSCRMASDGRVVAIGDPRLRFPYWSFTKTALAACALGLEEAGVLDPDAPVPDQPVPEAKFSLRQLLRHEAGLPEYTVMPVYQRAVAADEDAWPEDVLAKQTWQQGMRFAPGGGWAYSNFGYMIALRRIEALAGCDFAALFQRFFGDVLAGEDVFLAQQRADFDAVHWQGARHYDPRWVYHGCLVGTALGAVRMLDGLMRGKVIGPAALARMCEVIPLGGGIAGRPWTKTGYGTGLMIGEVGAAGQVLGHGGSGPFCVNTVLHFPKVAGGVTVACFAEGDREPEAEHEAVRLALELAS